MKCNLSLLIIGLIVSIASVASAASGGDQGTSDIFANTANACIPLVLFLGLVFFFLRRQLKLLQPKLQQQYMERQIQHTQRVEELLERIAKALEKNDHNAA